MMSEERLRRVKDRFDQWTAAEGEKAQAQQGIDMKGDEDQAVLIAFNETCADEDDDGEKSRTLLNDSTAPATS